MVPKRPHSYDKPNLHLLQNNAENFRTVRLNGLRAFGPSARFIPSFDVFLSIDVFSTVQFKKKTCLATQNIRGVALSRYKCAEMQDRFSVFIQV